MARPAEQEADVAGARATGRVAQEMYRDSDFVIYRLAPAGN